MALDQDHIGYLSDHSQGRLATIGADGSPQNKPVGYTYNVELGVIDIGGFNMEASAKYRNVVINPEVSFVVDDAIGQGPAGMRFVEVRGRAVQAELEEDSPEGERGTPVIRVRPSRVVSWNVGQGEAKFRSFDLRIDGSSDIDAHRPSAGIQGSAAKSAVAAVQSFVGELQQGWDVRDADITNRHFASDLVWGSPFGATVLGYEDLHAIHLRLKKEGRGGPSSRFEIVAVLVPAAGIAVAQVRRVALDENGEPVVPSHDTSGSFSELILYVLVKRGDNWWLAAGHNTPIRLAPGN